MGDALRAYGTLAWAWLRAAAQYPVSMVLLGLASAAVAGLDAAGIGLLFSRVHRLGGFGAAQVLFLYATSQLAFVLSDALLGNADLLARHVREGTFDAMLLRPVSPLVQVATEEYSPRRFAKLVLPAVLLAIVLPRLDTSWTAGRVAMVPVMVASGTAIFCGLWVLVASVQFVLLESHGAGKALTFGGSFLTQYPMSVFARDFVRGVTFAVPLAFVNWQPALYVLDRPDPLGLPAATRLASPAVAVAVCGLAALAWRAGLRRYRSTGS
ncbi:ABC transporter permease [Actinomadura rayongensis]